MSRQGRAPAQLFPLTDLPALPVDKVIQFLDAEDLRRFHQVSVGWRTLLESRPRDNARRVELVRKIRGDKENISPRGPIKKESLPTGVVALRAVREQRMSDLDPKKAMESPVLMECTNQFENTPTSESNHALNPDCNNSLTPSSCFVFQNFQKAEKSLEPGQKLFQCRKCQGPVPSPVSSNETGKSRRNSSQYLRCKLITKLNSRDEYNDQFESPEKSVSKKAKTLSEADLSPIQYSPQSPPVTVASLGDKMAYSLVVSSPCLTSSTSAHNLYDQIGTSTPRVDIKRSTSCSSIVAIDLPPNVDGERSSINFSLNMSKNDFDSSMNLELSGIGIDLHSDSLSCAKSCCRPVDMHMSQFSDSGFSHDSESNTTDTEFANFVPSPVAGVLPVNSFSSQNYDTNSIERGRNNLEYNSSNGGFHISSLHLQRSDSNFSAGNSIPPSQDIPTLECPNPNCRFRFCSNCEECEHPYRSCHLISSDHIESFIENSNNSENCIGLVTTSSNITDSSHDSGIQRRSRPRPNNHKKLSLKRLARL